MTRRKHPPRAPQPTIAPSRLPARDRWILVALVIVPLGVYGRVTGYDFVTYDDPKYVTDNPMVRGGLSAPGLDSKFDGVSLAQAAE